MKLPTFGLLTDQNIHPEVLVYLRGRGFNVRDVKEEGWADRPDSELLESAFVEDRIVVTHDSDFGTLAILAGQRAIGILYLRPGHVGPTITIDSLRGLLRADLELHPPFIVVARRSGGAVSIRVRHLL